MTLHNEDRQLQIKLAKLQMVHQTILSGLIGFLAIEASWFGVFMALYYSEANQQWKSYFVFLEVAILALMMFTALYFMKKLRENEKEIQKLEKKYIW